MSAAHPKTLAPLRTILAWTIDNPTAPLAERRWTVHLTCGHKFAGVRHQPLVDERRRCASCRRLRTSRVYALAMGATADLTYREVEFLRGCLAEWQHQYRRRQR